MLVTFNKREEVLIVKLNLPNLYPVKRNIFVVTHFVVSSVRSNADTMGQIKINIRFWAVLHCNLIKNYKILN